MIDPNRGTYAKGDRARVVATGKTGTISSINRWRRFCPLYITYDTPDERGFVGDYVSAVALKRMPKQRAA